MALQSPNRLFTVDEYERMIEAGILTENDRVELVDGEIVERAARGSHHSSCTNRITDLFYRYARQSAIVRVQEPVRVGRRSELEPDIALVRLRDDLYAGAHPVPADVLLLVEVSDTTLAYDHGLKLALYAGAGIPEVWVVSLPDDMIEVYALPKSGKYQAAREAHRGETIEARSVPGLTLAVDDILG